MVKSKSKRGTPPKKKAARKKAARKKDAKAAVKKSSRAPGKKSIPQKRSVASFAAGTGTVYITYNLTKTPDVSIASVYFSTTRVSLSQDRDASDPDKFQSQSPYAASTTNGDVRVRVNANGQSGGGWKLNIFKNEVPSPDNRIDEHVNANGRADHDSFH